MAKTYTEEQLNTFDKATLIQLLLMQQSQLQEIDKKLQLLLEQAAVLYHGVLQKSWFSVTCDRSTSDPGSCMGNSDAEPEAYATGCNTAGRRK